MPGGSVISFSCVDSSLSSLKNCQSYINTGMDIATNVALDLVESCKKTTLKHRLNASFSPNDQSLAKLQKIENRRMHILRSFNRMAHSIEVLTDRLMCIEIPDVCSASIHSLAKCLSNVHCRGTLLARNGIYNFCQDDEEEVNSMERVMLEYAAMDRELKHYMQAVQDTVHQIKRDKPEDIPDLKDVVKQKFTALESKNKDSDLQKNEKYMHFMEQLKRMRKQFGLQSDADANEAIEQIDEDIAVTQSQMNFICPITQMEMENPVRNKVCGHTYEKAAILKIIQHREHQKKKASCPKIGCTNLDVKKTDLVQDEVLKRAIDSQNKQSRTML